MIPMDRVWTRTTGLEIVVAGNCDHVTRRAWREAVLNTTEAWRSNKLLMMEWLQNIACVYYVVGRAHAEKVSWLCFL